MNTIMNNKYYEMHTEVLEVCENKGIKMIPGVRVAYEILTERESDGIKEFLLTPDDMECFYSVCEDEFKHRGYTLVRGKFKGYEFCRIFREDMLASSVPILMSSPSGRHCPQFIVRRLGVEDGVCSYTSNSKVIAFREVSLNDMEKTAYKGSVVYAKKDMTDHMRDICGIEDPHNLTLYGYALFSTECSAEEFIREAKNRGYLSPERISRYNEYTEWKKENRAENEKKFKEYQEVLLGLKQP